MTTDLRSELVEAMAQAIRYADDNTPTDEGWETFDAHASAALDALLDGLEERRDEWIEAEARLARVPPLRGNWSRTPSSNVERLIAALRADSGKL